ncbi:MAG: dTMP kinase [Candidatus Omnitrophica bacterium]|nr:dTMP kinase [Candidatus Omnitrophota bacterium]
MATKKLKTLRPFDRLRVDGELSRNRRQAQGLYPERSRRIKRGVFITFEGIEGCGKSTHSKLLSEYLENKGYPCVHTREPGGTKLGEAVRKVLLDSPEIRISDLAELFLFEACRAQIVKEIIRPALDRGRIVISDRFSDATFSYQGYGGRVDLKAIRTLDRVATAGVVPDLTMLLDIDTSEGLRRARKKGIDRMEKKDLSYHRRVRAGYLRLSKQYPGRIKRVKVSGRIPEVQAKIRREVEIVLRKFERPR